MKSTTYACLCTILCLITCYTANAQADTVKYKERADAVSQEVWGWNAQAFSNYKVPSDFANESSVILARRAVIEADSKKKGLSSGSRRFYYNSTVREMVRINDKASLEEYSQLNYSQFKKLNGWISGTATTFVGARIIKPDGKIRKLSLDESILLNAPGNGMQRKLAISDLQVGDILDYYVRVEEYSIALREPERLIFVFGDDHPILDYSIHCNIGDKYAVEYRSMNNAAEARQTTNEDKDLILDLDVKNIAAVPTALWMSSLRELPAFRINVLAGATAGRSTGDVIKDVPLVDVLNRSYPTDNVDADILINSWVVAIIHEYDHHFYKIPKDSMAYLVYYAHRFALYYNRSDNADALEVGEARNHMELNEEIYLTSLRALLRHYDIKSEFVALPSRYGPTINNIMSPGDFGTLLRVDIDKPFYVTCGNMFTCPGYTPSYAEGQPGIELLQKKMRSDAQIDQHFKMPVSDAAENAHRETLQIDISGNDMQLIHVKRQTTLTGKMKIDEQPHLLNFEDCYEAERNDLHVKQSVMDVLKKARKSRNVSEDYATAVEKAKASMKDRFKDEVSSEFEEDPKDMISWKIINPGIRHYAPDLVYSTEFTMDGLLQRAGNNLIFNIGKAVSSPLKLTPSQRNRKVDIYMPYARTQDFSLSFTIPQGYTVQGVDKLNKKLENDCGSLVTTAQVEGNQLLLHFKRVYKHNTELAAKWPEMLAIIDATVDFAGQKVLLKKG